MELSQGLDPLCANPQVCRIIRVRAHNVKKPFQ
jgi:hypothetical protein